MDFTVDVLALVYQEDPPTVCENLSPLDISPLLLKATSCPAVKFDYPISFAQLRVAATALLEEYPILGGRVQRVSHVDVIKAPYLKAAPYCINLAHLESGLLLFEAKAHCSSSDVDVEAQHSSQSDQLGFNSNLPPWYQPLDMSAMLKGKESLLKIQLTHTNDSGSILTATMPQFLADCYSSTVLLTRLAELYKQHSKPLSPTSADKLPRIRTLGLSTSAEAISPWLTSPAGEDLYSNECNSTDEFLDPLDLNRQDSGVSSNDSEAIVPMVSRRRLNTPCHPLSPIASGKPAHAADIRALSASDPILSATVSSTMVSPRAFTSSINSHHKTASGRLLRLNLSAESPDSFIAAEHESGYVPGSCGSTGSAEAGGPAGVAFCQLRASQDAAAVALVAEKACGKAWSRSMLMPKESLGSTAAAAARDGLQAVPHGLLLPKKPGLCERIRGKLRRLVSAVCCLPRTTVVTSKLLQIPQHDVEQLKALATTADVSRKGITTSDVVSALLWMVMCELRDRPMPGSSSGGRSSDCCSKSRKALRTANSGAPYDKMCDPSDSKVVSAPGGYLGLSVDCRRDCRDLAQRLPSYYLGNTTSAIYVSCGSSSAVDNDRNKSTTVSGSKQSSNPHKKQSADICPAGPDEVTGADAAGTVVADSAGSDQPNDAAVAAATRVLQTATAAVRQSVLEFRAAEDAGSTLLRVMQQQTASTMQWSRSMASLNNRVDAFVTCQQLHTQTLDFGAGPPSQSSCLLQPSLPWRAVILPGQAAVHNNVKVLLTVPDFAVENLLHSKVLKQLAPNAHFLGE